MSLSNKAIAEIFENVADMLEIQGEKIFRVLSYRRAAETIRELPRDLHAYREDGTLTEQAGIGQTIADKIGELLDTGQLAFYERLKGEVPLSLLDIKRINGVGPKKAALFWKALNITTLDELEAAAIEQKLQALSGMGKKSEQKILSAIAAMRRQTGRTPLGVAKPAADALLAALLDLPEALEGIVAGSIRRGRPTIGDVDLLIASDQAEPIMQSFVEQPHVARILGQGPTKSSVELENGLQVDLRVLSQARWGTALQYFTGSQAHNVRIRQIALEKGYSLNEHALRPVDREGNIDPDAEPLLCATEEAVYEAIGLPWIAPELREDAGEIERARHHDLPRLITIDAIQGDLHMHTTASDGTLSVREMAEAARRRGRRYIVITDHSRSLGVANGLSIERLMAQQQEVRAVNAEMGEDFHVLHGTEMDIRADGQLDYPDEVLQQLDFVIASLHTGLNQERDKINQRLLTAIRNPHVDMIAHPAAQQIGHRDPVNADWDVVFQAALEQGTMLEINANPARLDLDAPKARRAQDLGITLAINTDAHNEAHMDLLPFGILTARRGWIQAENVINTWPYERFIERIQSRG